MQPYLVMLYLGIVAGVISGTIWAGLHGLNAARSNLAMLLLVLPALLGARLLFVVLHWQVYRSHTERILRRTEGGAALYGGLVSAFLFSFPVLSLLDLPVWAFWDAVTVCLLVGMIFTKVGCLWNCCCSGKIRFPLQLVEAVMAALILVAGIVTSRTLPFEGAVFLSATAVYSLARFALEPLRLTIDRIGGLSVNRAVSAGLVLLSTSGFLLIWFSH